MALIGNFVSKVVDNILKGLEVRNVFIDHILGVGVILLANEGVEGLLIIGDDPPAGADAAEDVAEILHPAIEILILPHQLLVLASVRLQLDGHLVVLTHQQAKLEILVLHKLNQ